MRHEKSGKPVVYLVMCFVGYSGMHIPYNETADPSGIRDVSRDVFRRVQRAGLQGSDLQTAD